MPTPEADQRTPARRARDEQIAAEPPLSPMELPDNAPFAPVEAHLNQNRPRPVAMTGIVKNGLVRPLDAAVKLPEHSRVIIVASEGT